jgi:hypothetical protein
MAGIVKVMASQSVIAFPKIRQGSLRPEKYFDAIVNAMQMRVGIGVKYKIRIVHNLDLETIAQEVNKEVIGFTKPRPKIAKIDPEFRRDFNHGFHG